MFWFLLRIAHTQDFPFVLTMLHLCAIINEISQNHSSKEAAEVVDNSKDQRSTHPWPDKI